MAHHTWAFIPILARSFSLRWSLDHLNQEINIWVVSELPPATLNVAC